MKNLLKLSLFATALTPVVFWKSILIPYTTPKVFFFRTLVFLALFLFTVLISLDLKFRKKIIEKIQIFKNNKVVWCVLFSYVILVLSTIFAYSPSVAFTGTMERGEGLVGLSFLYIIFFLFILIFEKKDWYDFFQISIFSGFILFIVEMVEKFNGTLRPGSLVDNPIFLAVYLLFILFFSLLFWSRGVKENNNWFKFIGIFAGLFSVLGILITESRGVMLGIFLGVILALFYLVFKGKNIYFLNKYSLQKISVGILVLIVSFSALFFMTRHFMFWQKIPGFSRLADFDTSDGNTQARLLLAKTTVQSLSPKLNSFKNNLLGWGWDNYSFLWQKIYPAELFSFDRGIFDRTHNKLLDIWSMNGLLGLFAYLSLWFFLFKELFKIKNLSRIEISFVLFLLSAFFVQGLFAMDTITSYLFFYVIIGFIIFNVQEFYEKK
ncbi:O-antigen ligase family protein [Candidatus Nomurabacteria bacterium]|nr:O-antigen ligase family protein [Candidatus Nomurabacteria bacterium]